MLFVMLKIAELDKVYEEIDQINEEKDFWETDSQRFEFSSRQLLRQMVVDTISGNIDDAFLARTQTAPDSVINAIRFMKWTRQDPGLLIVPDNPLPSDIVSPDLQPYIFGDFIKMSPKKLLFTASSLINIHLRNFNNGPEPIRSRDDVSQTAGRLLIYTAQLLGSSSYSGNEFDVVESVDRRITELGALSDMTSF
jgi:hypothetical protein